jgi:catechol 2,3-dioxygenase-like lactoylglutathione lyase family enzyme
MQTGINHIEFWVSDLAVSIPFYKEILELIGWQQFGATAFATATMELYLKEMPYLTKANCLGVRHICFQANEKEQIEKVAAYLKSINASIIRGPILMDYSEGYYTVDFFDPDGFIIEVAHTPKMNFLL